MNLGNINATISLNASGFNSGIAQAISALRQLQNAGGAGFEKIDGQINALAASLSKLDGASISIDTGAIVGDVARAESTIEGIGDAIKTVSGTDLTIDVNTGSAAADVSSVESAVKQLDGAIDSIDTTPISVSVDTGNSASAVSAVESAVEQLDAAVHDVSTSSVSISVNTSQVAEAEAAVKSLADRLDELGSKFNTAGAGLSIIGTAVTASFGVAAGSAISFEAAMANVNSIANLSGQELDDLSDSIMKMSKDVGKGPIELAEGLYQIQSSGFEASEGLLVLEAAAIAAKAGMTDTATAARAVSSVLNAYGMDASEAANVSDQLFQTVNIGVLSFEELANNIGQLLPLGSALGVTFAELGAAMAVLTQSGISAAESETAIAAVMRAALNPTTELTAAVKEYGYSSAEALLKAEGFVGFLNVLQTASGGSNAALTDLLGTADATTGVLALLANNGQDYADALGQMNTATSDGAFTQEVLERQTNSTAASLEAAGDAFERFKIGLGEGLAPIIRAGAEGLTKLLNGFSSLSGPIQATIAILGSLAGVAALAAGGVLLLIPKIVEFQSALTKLGGMAGIVSRLQGSLSALSFVVSPLGIALGVIVAAGALVAKSWYDQKKAAEEYEASLQSLDDTLEMLRRRGDTVLADLGDGLSKLINGIPQDFDAAKGQLGSYQDFEYNREGELLAQGMSPAEAQDQIEQEWYELTNNIVADMDLVKSANDKMTEALRDPDIDATAFITWATDLINSAKAIDDPIARMKRLNEVLAEIDGRPLSDFSVHITEAGTAADASTGKLEKFFGVINDGLDSVASKVKENLPEQSWVDRLGQSLGLDTYDVDSWWDQFLEGREAQIDARRDRWLKAIQVHLVIPDITAGLNGATSDSREIDRKAAQFDELGYSINGVNDAGERATATLGTMGIAAITNMRSSKAYAESLIDTLQTGADRMLEIAQEQTDAANEMVDSLAGMQGVDPFLARWNMTDRASEASILAQNINQTTTALDNANRVIIGNTNAIASNVSGLNDWATELIGVRGEYSALDDLLASGRIDQGQYDAAQNAQEQIAAANESIKTSIQDIQVTAAPILGDLATRQANYMEQLSGMTAQQQLVALGWMDATTSANAYTIMQQAVAVGNGEMGASGAKAFESMIQGAVTADPILGSVLEDMGLISIGADGTITVHYDSAKGAKSEIAMLTESIDALTLALGGVPPLHIDVVGGNAAITTIDAATAALKSLKSEGGSGTGSGISNALSNMARDIANVDGTKATVTIDADDADARAKVATAQSLNGKTLATSVIKVIADMAGDSPDTSPTTRTVSTRYAKPDTSALYDDSIAPVTIPTVAAPIQGPPDYSGVPVVVPVTLDMAVGGNALAGAQGAAQDALGSISNDITITTTLELIDNASGPLVVAFDQFQLMDGQMATVTLTAMTESAASAIGGVKQKIEAVPTTWSTTFSTVDDATAITNATNVEAAVEAVPTTWVTAISTSGEITAIMNANAVEGAIEAIPEALTTYFFTSGQDTAIQNANNVAAAVNSIPSSKTITINTVNTVSSAGGVTQRAKGGYVREAMTELAERGPEALRMPDGSLGMATRRGLYTLPHGTFVFTADQTRNLMKDVSPIRGYASGGTVGGANSILLGVSQQLAAYKGDDTPKQIVDLLKEIRDLGNSDLKNNRGLIQDLTGWQKTLADYKVDDKHPVETLAAAKKLADLIKSLTTGGTFKVGKGITESYGLSDKFYGSKTPVKTPTKTPTTGSKAPRTTYVDNRQFFAVKSTEFAKLQSDAEKGAQVHAGVSGLGSTSQTSRIRGTGVM